MFEYIPDGAITTFDDLESKNSSKSYNNNNNNNLLIYSAPFSMEMIKGALHIQY